MTATARSLLITRPLLITTSLYFAALGAVAVSLYAGLSALAPAVQAHFLHSAERQQSRLDLMIANAREIRQALAVPVGKVEPLPPITAKPLHAAAKPQKAPIRKLNPEALSAFAMSEPAGGSNAVIIEDRHRVQ